MTAYPLSMAQKDLSRLIDLAQSGEVVTILREDRAVAELRAIEAAPTGRPSPQLIDEIAARAKQRSPLGQSAESIVRAMRDEQR